MRGRGPGARLWRGGAEEGEIWVLCGGIGRERISGALAWAGGIVAPKIVISTGCAGALDGDVAVGELLIADETVGDARGGTPRRSSSSWIERYGRAAKIAQVPHRVGRLLTSGSLVAAEGKAKAARDTGAAAVDMETLAIAEWAAGVGATFAAARVVLDSLSTSTPPEIAAMVGPTGRPRPHRVLWTLLRNPRILGDLGPLARAQKQCSRALEAVHGALFSELG